MQKRKGKEKKRKADGGSFHPSLTQATDTFRLCMLGVGVEDLLPASGVQLGSEVGRL
jgi:hypothetical protein